jgi:hypothetical protein
MLRNSYGKYCQHLQSWQYTQCGQLAVLAVPTLLKMWAVLAESAVANPNFENDIFQTRQGTGSSKMEEKNYPTSVVRYNPLPGTAIRHQA